MKFRCEQSVLDDVLSLTRRATGSRTAGMQQVLSGVRLVLTGDQLEATGSDLELTIRATATVSGSADGACVVPAQFISDIVKSLDSGAVTVETEGETLSLTWGRSSFSLTLFELEQYPSLPEPSGPSVTLPSAEVAEALRRVVRAASTDDHRPILTGVRLEPNDAGGLRMVATDSYRLALSDLAGSGSLVADHKVLVPSRALSELVRALDKSGDVQIRLGERDVTFEAGNLSLQTRLIDGEFPNYRQLIPTDYKNRLQVSKAAFGDAVRRVKLMAADSKNIKIRMSSDGLELSAVNQEWGTATDVIDAEYAGEEITVAFNPDYLSAGLDGVPTDEVVLETQNAMKPAVLHGTDDSGYLYLLMPVRVS